MRLLILLPLLMPLLAVHAVEPAKDVKDKPKKVEEAVITPLVREFLAAVHQAGATPSQEQCDKPLTRLLAKGPYEYDTPAARTNQRVALALLIKRQGQPNGIVELGHWNYLDKAERAWYMVPCQHGMFFMHLVTAKLPDGKTPFVLSCDFSENINSVPRELVHPEVVVVRQAEAEADKSIGEKAPGDKPAGEKNVP